MRIFLTSLSLLFLVSCSIQKKTHDYAQTTKHLAFGPQDAVCEEYHLSFEEIEYITVELPRSYGWSNFKRRFKPGDTLHYYTCKRKAGDTSYTYEGCAILRKGELVADFYHAIYSPPCIPGVLQNEK